MSQQCPNRVEVHSRTHHFAGCSVSQHVRSYSPVDQGRDPAGTTLDEPIDPESGVRPSIPAEENGFTCLATLNQLRQCARGFRQQRALTYLAALSVQRHKSMAPVAEADLHITHSQVSGFGDSCPDMSKKVENRVFDAASLR